MGFFGSVLCVLSFARRLLHTRTHTRTHPKHPPKNPNRATSAASRRPCTSSPPPSTATRRARVVCFVCACGREKRALLESVRRRASTINTLTPPRRLRRTRAEMTHTHASPTKTKTPTRNRSCPRGATRARRCRACSACSASSFATSRRRKTSCPTRRASRARTRCRTSERAERERERELAPACVLCCVRAALLLFGGGREDRRGLQVFGFCLSACACARR